MRPYVALDKAERNHSDHWMMPSGRGAWLQSDRQIVPNLADGLEGGCVMEYAATQLCRAL